jgi:hypothetical protein
MARTHSWPVRDRMPRSEVDLDRLIQAGTVEDLHHEYKRAETLLNQSATHDITKVISAFANADGGLMLLGVEAKDGVPVALRPSIDPRFSRERLEDIVNQVRPKVSHLEIVTISTADGLVHVLGVPASTGTPHQASNFTYYRRYQSKCQPMYEHEIEDLRRRVATPGARISVDFEVRGGFLFDFVIRNVGDFAAEQITLTITPEVRWRTGIPPALTRPIRRLAPGRRLAFGYATATDLFGQEPSRSAQLAVVVTFVDSLDASPVTETFELNAMDHEGTLGLKTDVESIVHELREGHNVLREAIGKVSEQLGALARVADPTGLALSITTVRRLTRLRDQEPALEKLRAKDLDAQCLREVLGVDLGLAWRLQVFFQHGKTDDRDCTAVGEVRGVTPELEADIKRLLVY